MGNAPLLVGVVGDCAGGVLLVVGKQKCKTANFGGKNYVDLKNRRKMPKMMIYPPRGHFRIFYETFSPKKFFFD